MGDVRTTANGRDDLAADRDDAADARDVTSADRDDSAAQRDTDADERDDDSHQHLRDLDALITHIRWATVDAFARIEGATVDPTGWPDLTGAGLAHLRAHTAEQRRLAGLDRAAITGLLDDLRDQLHHARDDIRAGEHDRQAAARDRRHSAHDRSDSAQDRDLSARDRGQATIEREQVSSGELQRERYPAVGTSMADHVALAVAASRRRIADSRAQLDRERGGS